MQSSHSATHQAAASALSGLAGALPGGLGCAGAAVASGCTNAWLERGAAHGPHFPWQTVVVRALATAVVASLSQGAHTLYEKPPLKDTVGLMFGAGLAALVSTLGGAWIGRGWETGRSAPAAAVLPVSCSATDPAV